MLTLRLGIGATTAILTLTDAILVRSLTADRPEELVVVHAYGLDGNRTNLSHPLFERLRHEPAFAGMFAALDGNQTAVLTLE